MGSEGQQQPLTSATYIPVGDSFGPGVGIPPLFDSHSRPTYDAYGNPVSNGHRIPSNQLYERHAADGTYRREASIPLTPSSQNVPPSLSLHDNVHELVSPGPPAATVQHSQPVQTTTDLTKSPSHRYNDSSTSLGGLSPCEAAVRWPLDRVLLWLAKNGFSRDWQETFKELELQGADFLELGHGSGGRGNLGKMHQVVYPQLAKECERSGTGWDQARERDEGKRMRKLIRQIHDDGSHDISATPQKRRDSHPSVAIPPPEGTGGPAASPKLGNEPAFAAPRSATSEYSPGFKAPQLSHNKRQSMQMRSVTLPVPPSHDSSTIEPSGNEPTWHRGDYSKAAFSGTKGDHRRQSPSTSSENGLFSGLSSRYYEESPKSGSPAMQQASLAHSGPTGELSSKYEHSRGNSTDSITGVGRGTTPTTRYYESLRQQPQQLDGARPSPQDSYTRQWSGETSSYPKEHSKGFLHKFKRRPKPGEPSHPSPEEQNLESPTSPVNLRQNIPYLPYTKPNYNSSDLSVGERPSSSSTSDHERLAMRTKPTQKGKKWMLVTMDGWNYRLVDVTDLDSVENLRSAICQNLGISDWPGAQIFLTEPGQTDHEEPLNDTMLALCRRTKSDSFGSLKLFVRGTHTHPGANPSSSGLGVSFPEKPLASPTAGQYQLHRKPLDEEALSRISPHTQPKPTSPRQQTVGPATLRPSGRDAHTNTSPADAVPESNQLLEPDKADLLARHEEHLREVERKQRAYRITKVPPASQPTKDAAYSETGYRREGVIDFDSPRISPYEDKKSDTLVPLRKPPTAPNRSNTLTKVNSLSKRNVDRPRAPPPPVQTHGLGAVLANMGRMTSAIGTPSPSVPVPSPGSHGDASASRSTPGKPLIALISLPFSTKRSLYNICIISDQYFQMNQRVLRNLQL